MKGFILAAGLGTRLKPYTDTRPKALVPLCGVPLLDIVAERLVAAGCSELIVNVHHFAGQIIDHLSHKDYGVPVYVSDESDLLRDTGGAIRHAAQYIKGDGPVLVHNVDIISDIDLREFASMHRSGDIATLLVSRRETSRYLLFGDDGRLRGWTNVKTGEIKSPYGEAGLGQCVRRAFSGIHIISPEAVELMTGFPEKFSIIDFYLSVAATHCIRACEMPGVRVMDVGKAETVGAAERMYSEINNGLSI